METWNLGAILTIVGLLLIGCGLWRMDLGLPVIAGGLVSSSVGSYVFVTKFKTWIDNL